MKTKEVQQLTGLSKQTLIWYEKEGLIHPERNENHYREYSDQDIKILKLIKTLRSMDVSLDDIHQMLDNHLSVEEIFEEQKLYLQKESQRIKETQRNVCFYKETNVPLIEELSEMYSPKPGFGGRPKSPKPFHIGTYPDSAKLKKLVFCNILWGIGIIFLGIFFVRNFENVWGMALPVQFLIQVPIAAAVLLFFGFGIPQMGFMSMIQRYSQYVQLDREGIFYIKADTLREKIVFLCQSLRDQGSMAFMPYTQIEKVIVRHDTKYIKTFSPIAHELSVMTAAFYFKDGTSCTIRDRLFYENDEAIIVRVLKEHVEQVTVM